MAFTKIAAAGIGTTETVTVDGLTVINNGSFGGNLSVGGTLTYEDVTNVDSVGLITARNGIVVGSGITLSKDGDIFATGITTITGLVDANGGAHIDNLRLGIDADNDITTSSGNLTLDSAAGNVVINDNLDVDGTATFDGVVSIADKIVHTGDINTAIRFPAADTITAETGGDERLRIDSSGNLGLGINSPDSEIHLSKLGASDEPTIKISSENSSIFLRTAGSSGSFPTGGTGNDGELVYLGGDFRFGVGTASKNLIFFNGSGYTERLRIDSSGRVLIGHSSAVHSTSLQVLGATGNTSSISLSRFSNSAASPLVVFNKSRNATVGSNTVVQDDDTVGIIRWSGADGTDYSHVADIQGQIDGSPGDNDTPGRLVFSTTSDGASTTTERLRISSSGQLSTGAETAPDVSAGGLCLNQGAADTNIFSLKSSDIAHGVTTYDETDTYFSIRKGSGAKGGARIHGFTDAAGGDAALEFQGVIASDSDQGYCPIEFKGSEANGTGVQNIATNRRIVNIKNSDGTRIASFTGTGLTFGDDHAIDNALDDYEEGTYVATIYGSSTGTGAPFGMNPTNLRYTKVGRVVHVTGRVYINSSSNNPTGSARMLLPFTSAPNGSGHDGQGYSYVTRYNVYSPNNDWNLIFEVDPNASYGVFLWDKPGSAWDAATADGHINQNAAYYGFDFSYTTPT